MKNNLYRLLFLFTLYSPQIFCSKKQLTIPAIELIPNNGSVFKASLSHSINTDSLIISVNTNDLALLNNIKQYMKSIPGVNGAYYCNNHHVFIVLAGLPQESPPLTDLLKKQYPSYVIETKSGSVKELMNFCSFNDPADMAGLKAN